LNTKQSPYKKIGLRKWVFAMSAIFASASIAIAAQQFDFQVVGHFKKMMHSGDTTAKSTVKELLKGPGTWGVGAMAGLQGEILLFDGKYLVSWGKDEGGKTVSPASSDSVTLFAGGRVAAWADSVVPEDMSQREFETFLLGRAKETGLSLEAPFPFLVQGSFPEMVWHVVTGNAPGHAVAPSTSGHGAKHGSAEHNGVHANSQTGMKVFKKPDQTGSLVGVYSGKALEGVISHPGERFHVHFVTTSLGASGHVDAYSVKKGTKLSLPARMTTPVSGNAVSPNKSASSAIEPPSGPVANTDHSAHASHGHQHSAYAGLQARPIKALSKEQAADLQAGRGMSLSLPAELNGYPGPAHVLELATELSLLPDQKEKIQNLFKTMQREARALGEKVIAAEKDLDSLFKTKKVTAQGIKEATMLTAEMQGRLREVHLRFHLLTTELLSKEQIQLYDKFRGYSS